MALGVLVKVTLSGRFIWNGTRSVPTGVYWLARSERLERGQLVALPIPESVEALVRERGYVLRSVRLLTKPIAALEGDHVCVQNSQLVVNGQPLATVLQADRSGRSMPQHSICRRLGAGELFLATNHADSFDSRNFGPVTVGFLRGTLTPLITF